MEAVLGDYLLEAFRQAIESRRLDVADLVLQALELYDTNCEREAVAAYDRIAKATLPSLIGCNALDDC